MVKTIFYNPIDFVWRSLTIKYLIKKQYEISHKRGSLFAVFANDTIGSFINVDGVFEKAQLDLLSAFLKDKGFDFNQKNALI